MAKLEAASKGASQIAYTSAASTGSFWFLNYFDPAQWAAIGVLASIVFGALTCLANIYFKWKDDRRKEAK